ncbi:MAG: hypothetical protein PHD37_17250 [Gallionellaceae bacterium]|nr:hypothetical protein [Gallionellaceae bacterium]
MAVGDHVTTIADGDHTREVLRERVRVYRNDWTDLLDAELSRQFVSETWERIKLMLDTSQNIFRRIVRETCTVYNTPVKRELIVPSTEGKAEPQDVPAYTDRLREMDFDWRMAEAQRISKAAWACFLRPRMLRSTGEMRLDIITPDIAHVDLAVDDPMRMVGFGYLVRGKDKTGNEIECWVYYTDEKVVYLDGTGVEIENPFSDDLDVENPYGRIPVVPFFCTSPTIEFWDLHWNKDAVRANYIIGVLNTYINYLVKTQSFKQLAFSGNVSTEVMSAIADPLFPFVLPAGATAATLDLNTQLGAIDQVIKGKVMAIANNYGISSENFNVTGNIASGYSLRVANRALEEIREQDKLVAQKTEVELFNLVRLINNTDGGEIIPENLELRWNPGEISYPPAMWEEQSRWEFEFQNGIKNQIDYLIDDDPELTRDEAMIILEQVKKEAAQLKPKTSVLETMFGEGGGNTSGSSFGRKQSGERHAPEGTNASDEMQKLKQRMRE